MNTWKQENSLFSNILVFISSWDFMFNRVEHENGFNPVPGSFVMGIKPGPQFLTSFFR